MVKAVKSVNGLTDFFDFTFKFGIIIFDDFQNAHYHKNNENSGFKTLKQVFG